MTFTQLHELLAVQRKSVPEQYRRSGRHIPTELLLELCIVGTSLGNKMCEAATEGRPGNNPEWITRHIEYSRIHSQRKESYADLSVVPPAEEEANIHPKAGVLLGRTGTTRLYVIGTHAGALQHTASSGFVVSHFLALHHIVEPHLKKYFLLNDESLCGAVNNGTRQVVDVIRGSGVQGNISRETSLRHTSNEFFRDSLFGLNEPQRDDVILDPDYIDMSTGGDGATMEAFEVLAESLTVFMESDEETVGCPSSATFSTARHQVTILRIGLTPPFVYHVIDLSPVKYRYTSPTRNDNIVGGSRIVCEDKEQLCTVLQSVWQRHHGHEFDENMDHPDMNEVDPWDLEQDARVVVLQCFHGNYPTSAAQHGNAQQDEINLGIPEDDVEEIQHGNDAVDERGGADGDDNRGDTTGNDGGNAADSRNGAAARGSADRGPTDRGPINRDPGAHGAITNGAAGDGDTRNNHRESGHDGDGGGGADVRDDTGVNGDNRNDDSDESRHDGDGGGSASHGTAVD